MPAPMRTLIVDDEKLARERLHGFLAPLDGVEVVGEARNGPEALELIAREKPDLVFLDVQMPDGDGFDVLEGLAGARTPEIVFVTAHEEHALRAFEVAALGTVLFLPFILFTLPAGVWVDRLPRRPILIVGDFGRAALYASVPIAYVADALTLWQLYVVGFLVGTFQVFFDVAYQSYLPALVDRDQIVEGNSKLEISRSVAQISGPGLGGILVEILTAPYAVLVDAPCSGLGVLASRPDLRWRAEPLPELQRELLRSAISRVRPGGTVVYSTCTINREENEDVVDAVLDDGAVVLDASLGDEWPAFRHRSRPELLQTLPHVHGTSGFFVARLRRA